MAERVPPNGRRFNIDPTYDLARHIATGERGPLSGDDVLMHDREADRNDPMDDWTRPASLDPLTTPNSYDQIVALNAANARGNEIDPADLDGHSMDMGFGNRATPNPGEGGLQYGNNNTGADKFRGSD